MLISYLFMLAAVSQADCGQRLDRILNGKLRPALAAVDWTARRIEGKATVDNASAASSPFLLSQHLVFSWESISLPLPKVRMAVARGIGRHCIMGCGSGGSKGGPATAAVQRDASAQQVVAYWRQGGGLAHVVLTEAGHMVPRDAPLAACWMLERWMAVLPDDV